MGAIKPLSERITYKDHGNFLTVVISPRLDEKKQFLLTFWLFAWTFCGLVFISQLFFDHPKEFKLTLVVLSVFWLYYEIRIAYVWMWRRKGVELLKIEDGKLSYKRSIRKYGKVHEFYIDNIEDLTMIDESKSVGAVLGNSFWVIGGERITFNYQTRSIKFGVQLNTEEAKTLLKFLRKSLQEEQQRFNQEQERLAAEAIANETEA